jgi:hypothetical protein
VVTLDYFPFAQLWKIEVDVSVYKQHLMRCFILYSYLFAFTTFICLISNQLAAQASLPVSYVTIKPKIAINKIGWCVVEEPATFPGGEAAWIKYLVDSTRYPTKGIHSIERFFSMQFIVSRDGTVKEAMALDSIQDSFTEEALRVIRASPKWNIATHNGRPISWRMVQGFYFKWEPPQAVTAMLCDSTASKKLPIM